MLRGDRRKLYRQNLSPEVLSEHVV
jgi:hypothetical protein